MRLTNLADELRWEHPWLKVVEIAEVDTSIHVGDTWKYRGHQYAGSGPLNVTWHHTASAGSQVGILRFELYKYSIPGNNSNIAPDGTVYLLAAGSTATNGSVTRLRFSRGMGGNNSDSFTMEIHNPGNGSQPYPQAQIDAAFAVSNTVNRLSGNRPTDLCTHHELAPGRKTDPAPASAMRGPFRARACNSSGTWHHDDLRTEAVRRSNGVKPPPPQPPPPPGEHPLGDFDPAAGKFGNAPNVAKGLAAPFGKGDHVLYLKGVMYWHVGRFARWFAAQTQEPERVWNLTACANFCAQIDGSNDVFDGTLFEAVRHMQWGFDGGTFDGRHIPDWSLGAVPGQVEEGDGWWFIDSLADGEWLDAPPSEPDPPKA